jgi:two-component sensor histidine kinase
VHEDLYRSANLASIQAEPYLSRIAANLYQAFGAANIQLLVSADDLSLDIDIAIPCGLILNELLTNTFKHAFPPRAAGPDENVRSAGEPPRVEVSLKRAGGSAVLQVCDNGVGLPAGMQVQAARSLGLRLVQRLSAQLHGSLAVESQAGACFTLTFPLRHPT